MRTMYFLTKSLEFIIFFQDYKFIFYEIQCGILQVSAYVQINRQLAGVFRNPNIMRYLFKCVSAVNGRDVLPW